jgi:hypothetical protein
MSELVGVDLRESGSARVSPGFRKIRDLGRTVWDESDNSDVAGSLGIATNAAGNLISYGSSGATVTDFESVSITVGATDTVHGWVYRLQSGSTQQIWLEFYDTVGIIAEAYTGTAGTVSTNVYRLQKLAEWTDATTKPWSVVVQGRLLYVYRQGYAPVLWFADTLGGGGPWATLVTDTGPGATPDAPDLALTFNSWTRLYNGGMGAERPFTEFPYHTSTDWTSITDWDPLDQFQPGAYSFAYQLLDTRTGRRSQLSEIASIEATQFWERVPYDTVSRIYTPADTIYSDGSYEEIVRYRSAGVPQQIDLDVNPIDTTKWNWIEIYRTLRIMPGGEAFAGVLLLDHDAEITDEYPYGTDTYTTDTFRSDLSLAGQKPYRNEKVFMETPPKGGVAFIWNGVVFVSKVEDDTDEDDNGNIGEVRWSSPMEASIEMFPPENRWYNRKVPTDEIIVFAGMRESLLAMSESRVYEVFVAGTNVSFRDMHEGYGVVSRKAYTRFADSVIYVSWQGIKEYQSDGRLVNLNSSNYKIQEEWKNSLGTVVGVSDPRSGLVMFLNTTEREILMLWTENRGVSEMHWCPFVDATEGVYSVTSGHRAQFVTRKGRILVVDDRREKVFATHSNKLSDGTAGSFTTASQISLWDTNGDLVLKATGNGTTLTVTGPTGFALSDCEDAICYIPHLDLVVQIVNKDELADTLTLETSLPTNFATPQTIFINPIRFLVKGFSTAVEYAPDGTPYLDVWRRRTLSTVSLFFNGVSGPSMADPAIQPEFWVENGLSETRQAESAAQEPGLFDESGEFGRRIRLSQNGVGGVNMFPVVEIVSSGIDYRLVSMKVMGDAESTDKPR